MSNSMRDARGAGTAIEWLRDAFSEVGHWDSDGIAEANKRLDIIVDYIEYVERTADNCLDNHAAVVHKLRAADARARHEARTSAWLAQFAADTIRGVNDVFREAIGERRSARITAFQPTAAELLTEAKEATRETR